MMGKDDFNKLNLKEQVEFINKNLDSKTNNPTSIPNSSEQSNNNDIV